MAVRRGDSSSGLAIRQLNAKPALSLTSTSFQPGQAISDRYSGYGDQQSPELRWTGIPAGAQSLVLILEDPDAPRSTPWVHWVLYNMPASATHLTGGLPAEPSLDQPAGATQGRHSGGDIGYFGPMPPKGHGTHHYHFQLFALDSKLDLPPGADRDEVVRAMKGRVLACGELIGTYEAA